MTSYRRVRWAGAISITLTLLALGDATRAGAAADGEPAAATDHFAFFSDFQTNLNDALIGAGDARSRGKPEPFHAGPDAACFEALPKAERVAWDRAVDYYGEIVSPGASSDREKVLLRLSLAGVVADEEWDDPGERRSVEIGRGFRTAAAPAYQACRWSAQDQTNRRWIDGLIPLLAEHETTLARRLAEVYQTPWRGVPFRVDVVETADWSGAHTLNVSPPGAHILISSSNPGYQGLAALEMIFHEAAHFLTGRDTSLPAALAEATRELGNPFHGDLAHAVNFYMTGEVVRSFLALAGKPGYTPYVYAQGLFDRGTFLAAIESTWPPYLDGERTLSEAAHDLIRALAQGARAPRPPDPAESRQEN